ncbi:Hypothetical predicted protein [Mytilus galloprovincialis]|uniref:Tyr recombinase domain-containing protein n=1 Tax=Mytilus galloprovincialis TaxID=29158 RepID=A0A8B6CTL9_MYTGA|nr:Hypothetical predicted protein [Mytilus galloprovincialis]
MKRSQNRPKDVRLPITRDLLSKIYNVLPAVCHNDFETKLFQASFSLAFFGFLRVGELTADHKHASTQSHAIEYNDIKINLSSIEIRLRSSKTDQCCTGTTIVIDVRPGDVCAVFALRNYLKVRPNVAGQLFCHFDGTPVTRYQFSGVLKKSLNVLGLSQGKYSSHSFRIGAATSAAMNGLSDSEIQAMGSPITIWIVGSSLVKNAFVQARRRPGGINLGLDHIGVRLWWLGKSGMRLKDLLNRIKLMLRYEEPPNYLVIHIGGNDLGEIKTGVLRNRLKHYVNNITELLLNTTLVWSQILPRLTWRYSANIDAMDRSRQRINSSLASYIIRHGGHYIRYPDISPNSTFICQDGVHLTDIGNYIFINTIQGALEAFLVYSPHTFPECKS